MCIRDSYNSVPMYEVEGELYYSFSALGMFFDILHSEALHVFSFRAYNKPEKDITAKDVANELRKLLN